MELLDRHLFPRINDFVLGERVRDLRREVARLARGRVLEIGAGTGLNFEHYPRGVEVVAVERAPGMRLSALKRAEAVEARVQVVDGDAQALAFDASSFDMVVST
ncbi:MAG: class I SAM-dependent methyltransferase, partial [Myxococcales bacterium]|nr:class I SAM-dependent methyltransferase [Myxococcales bacterium]